MRIYKLAISERSNKKKHPFRTLWEMVKLRRNKKYSSQTPKIHKRNKKSQKTNSMNINIQIFASFAPKNRRNIYLDQNEESYFVRITLSLFITASKFVLFSQVRHHSISHTVRNYYRLFCFGSIICTVGYSIDEKCKT